MKFRSIFPAIIVTAVASVYLSPLFMHNDAGPLSAKATIDRHAFSTVIVVLFCVVSGLVEFIFCRVKGSNDRNRGCRRCE